PIDVSAEHLLYSWANWVYPYSSVSRNRFDAFASLGQFSAFVYPFGRQDLPNRYANTSKIIITMFILDDQYEESWGDGRGRRLDLCESFWAEWESMIDKLEDPVAAPVPMTNWAPYLVGTYATLDAVAIDLDPIQRRRFVDLWRPYGAANVAETMLIKTRLHELTSIRMHTIGTQQLMMLSEYVEGVGGTDRPGMTAAEWASPLWQRYVRVCCEHMICVNDMFSFEKEYRQECGNLANMFNVVALTTRLAPGSTVSDGMRQIVARIQVYECSIIKIYTEIVTDGREGTGGRDGRNCMPSSRAMRRMADRMLYFVGGNYKFHTVCDRYRRFSAISEC
ncbi:unnamed protein product, partial [Medioppia subpectinata]